LTKASLYVYFGPVAVLVCRRFDHTPTDGKAVVDGLGLWSKRRQTQTTPTVLVTPI